jgi:hypothetical protein
MYYLEGSCCSLNFGMICCTEPVLCCIYFIYVLKTCDTYKGNYIKSLTMYYTLMTVTDRRQTRPLVREGAPQIQQSNFQTENNIWSQFPEWTWHQDILTDWPSVVTWLWLWFFFSPAKTWKVQIRLLVREGAPLQQTRNCLKIIKEKKGKIGRWSQMGAWHHDGLADWLSVVI